MIKNKQIHFIAIGGIGMSGLAKYLLQEGYSVSGSDLCDSKYLDELRNLGAKIYIGHKKENIKPDFVIVCSTAIKEDNIELKYAKELGLKILHRSDLLVLISDNFKKKQGKFIGISGTHGKTTTSGLCSYVLNKAEMAPSFVVGGIVPDLHTNANKDSGKFFVAELDESDGTIVKYNPDIFVLNNLESDHIDFYKEGLSSLVKVFGNYINALPIDTKVLYNNDNDGNNKLFNEIERANVYTFGLKNADFMAKNIIYNTQDTVFDLYFQNEFVVKIELSLIGIHNVYNALGTCGALYCSGIDPIKVAEYFKNFTGMGRRYQLVAEFDNIKIIDDYAHHPSEIKTTLDAAKKANSDKNRIVAIFQPHRYTRLKALYNEFLQAFNSADKLIVLDTYSAGESPVENCTPEIFAKDIDKKDVKYISGTIQEVAPKILNELKPFDIAITLGAGDVTKLGKLLLSLNNTKTEV